MEATVDQVAVKTEDVDTDIEEEEVESKRRLQCAKVKEEISDCLLSKCSSVLLLCMCTSFTMYVTDKEINIIIPLCRIAINCRRYC